MEQKALTKVQAIAAIVVGFFAIAIIGGLITQQISDGTVASGVRTILLLLWVMSIGVIWRMTKAQTK